MNTKLGLQWIAMACLAAGSGCTRDNPIFGDDGSTGAKPTSSGGATDPDGGMDTTHGGGGGSGSTTEGPPSTAPDVTTTGGPTDPTDPTTGGLACPDTPPVASSTTYKDCPLGACAAGECRSHVTDGAVQLGLSVCAVGCELDCECPVLPGSEALPACREGSCELDCSGGKACPEGMVCVEGATPRCMWANIYGLCDDTCLSAECFVGTTGANGGLCPLVSCAVAGFPDAGLCPPSPGGTAVPECLGDAIAPELLGWCVLSCEGGATCPAGMFCDGYYCLHG